MEDQLWFLDDEKWNEAMKKFDHTNMLFKLLQIKLGKIVVSNEELDEMIKYFQYSEDYEYCKILEDKKI